MIRRLYKSLWNEELDENELSQKNETTRFRLAAKQKKQITEEMYHKEKPRVRFDFGFDFGVERSATKVTSIQGDTRARSSRDQRWSREALEASSVFHSNERILRKFQAPGLT